LFAQELHHHWFLGCGLFVEELACIAVDIEVESVVGDMVEILHHPPKAE